MTSLGVVDASTCQGSQEEADSNVYVRGRKPPTPDFLGYEHGISPKA